MRVADTSLLVALFVTNDPRHAQAVAAVAKSQRLLVPAEVLSETLSILHKLVGPEASRRAGQALRTVPGFDIQPTPDDPFEDIAGDAWALYSEDKELSHFDAVVVAWCRRRRLAPLTFDRGIAKAAARP